MPTPTAPDAAETDPRPEDGAPGQEPAAREVVVGVDGTECGLGAVRWAAQEAAQRNAPLRIVHAAPYLGRRGQSGAPPPELRRARGITAVAYTVARHTEPDVRATTEVVPGDPVAALLRAAAASQLVVLGSSTTGAADEMVLATVPARWPRAPRSRSSSSRAAAAGTRTDGRWWRSSASATAADDEAVASVRRGRCAAVRRRRCRCCRPALRARQNVAASWVDDPSEWAGGFPGLDVPRSELPGRTGRSRCSAPPARPRCS